MKSLIAIAVVVLIGAFSPLAAQGTTLRSEPVLTIEGGGKIYRLSLKDLEKLGVKSLETTTPWTRGKVTFTGVLASDVIKSVEMEKAPAFRAVSRSGYIAKIPKSDIARYDVLIATHMNGRALGARDRGPLWVIYPDAKAKHDDPAITRRMVWQLTALICE
jgi:hypothetical protein